MTGIIANQAVIMLLLIMVGILAYRLKIVSREGGRQLSAVVLEIVTPVIVVHAYMDVKYSSELMINLLWTFALAAVSYILTISVAILLLRNKEGRETAIERFSAIYSNCGFMGIPLASALFGAQGVLYVTAFLTVFFFFSWTHGIMLLTGKSDMKVLLKVLRSPTIIAIAIGLVFYFTQLRLPSVITDTMNFIADLNTPLAMIASGVSVAQANILEALKNPRVYLVSFVKLLILPLITLIMCLFCGFISEEVRIVVLILVSAPSAAMCTLQCQKLGLCDTYASQIFAMTTILSVGTLPIMVKLFTFLLEMVG
ncbi:MAG: AEC family transporter [Ruminococcus sp.]|nr:AEC family transporter [Ruminococcus sp.]